MKKWVLVIDHGRFLWNINLLCRIWSAQVVHNDLLDRRPDVLATWNELLVNIFQFFGELGYDSLLLRKILEEEPVKLSRFNLEIWLFGYYDSIYLFSAGYEYTTLYISIFKNNA